MQPDIELNPVLLEIVDSAWIVPEATIFPMTHVFDFVISYTCRMCCASLGFASSQMHPWGFSCVQRHFTLCEQLWEPSVDKVQSQN